MKQIYIFFVFFFTVGICNVVHCSTLAVEAQNVIYQLYSTVSLGKDVALTQVPNLIDINNGELDHNFGSQDGMWSGFGVGEVKRHFYFIPDGTKVKQTSHALNMMSFWICGGVKDDTKMIPAYVRENMVNAFTNFSAKIQNNLKKTGRMKEYNDTLAIAAANQKEMNRIIGCLNGNNTADGRLTAVATFMVKHVLFINATKAIKINELHAMAAFIKANSSAPLKMVAEDITMIAHGDSGYLYTSGSNTNVVGLGLMLAIVIANRFM